MTRQMTCWKEEVDNCLERMLWRIEGWIDHSPRLSRWYTDWLLPRIIDN